LCPIGPISVQRFKEAVRWLALLDTNEMHTTGNIWQKILISTETRAG
jgi:hypothetical protein